MTKIRIMTASAYDVLVGKNILSEAGEQIKKVKKPCKIAVFSDDNVFPLYGEILRESLEKSGYEVFTYVFPHGEKSKNMQVLSGMLEFLAENRISRKDAVVALGGGVAGDISGFAASVYLRGIDFINIPTSLLAAVDSSVGGKTAVDLAAGKNLAGTFYQPSLVICDTETFKTLPEKEYGCGMAEAIKCAVIADPDFFERLYDGASDEEIVICSVKIKKEIVERDEFEEGDRKLLNFGHTAGHAIEKCSNFEIPHGQAVAEGMLIISAYAESEKIAEKGLAEKISALLEKYNIPAASGFSARQLAEAAEVDKKIGGKDITVVYPRKVGHAVLKEEPVTALFDIFEKGINQWKQ